MQIVGNCVVCGKDIYANNNRGMPKTCVGVCRQTYHAYKFRQRFRRHVDQRVAFRQLKDEPTKEEYYLMGVKPPKAGRVKCLGPIQPEHYFESEDIKKQRICPACRKRNAMKHGGIDDRDIQTIFRKSRETYHG